ncbi:sensor histidine kinase [Leucobacter chromiiresistens]|uniref:Signal transduction histidine kinase n=1 Tax=Leucobacter chromiiresistens TaxID=1079994 RepID=A0A1H0ZZ84_9MICO|nr:sensor histidine kinase [Leucobacter chromiiresistens]SDQ32774.1 Signal transduction histidine kinase [Leucobacter chromiiresistens]
MSIVNAPLMRTDQAGPVAAGATVRAMEIGQYLIAAILTLIGVIRAIGDGSPIPAAIVAGLAVLAWHTAGTILPSRTRSGRIAVWWLVSFAVIWIAAVAVSPEFVWIAFLLWLLAGHLLPVPWGVLFSGLVLTVVIIAPILHHGMTSYANVFGPLIGGIFAYGISRGYLQLLRDAAERERLVASLTRAQQEMADLQDELALVQRESGAVAERTRISRDIHDTIAQALSSIRLLAHAGAARSEDADAVRTLEQVETLAGDSLSDVRRIVAALAPAELEDNALAVALRRMLDRAEKEIGLRTELHVDEALPALSTEVEVALLRTAQSALANVRLHAGASRVVMSLIDSGSTVRLDLIDDGSGFNVHKWEQTMESGSGTSSYGLRFMRARLRELGGGLDIESTPGVGTAISVHLPLHPITTTQASSEPTAEETL